MKRDYEFYLHLEEYMKEVHRLACRVLKISPVRIKLDMSNGTLFNGCYVNSMLSEITIADANLTTYDALATTIAHETRHVWQHYYDKIDFSDYVSAEEDFDAYYNHIAEVDARNFADAFVKKFKTELDVLADKHVNREFKVKEPTVNNRDAELEDIFGVSINNEPIWG